MIILTAMNVDDLMRDLEYGSEQRSHACNSDLYSWDPDYAFLTFYTRCAGSGRVWAQKVQLMDYNYIVPEEDRDIDTFEEAKLLYPEILDSDVKVDCTCPDFAFRYRYIVDGLGSSLEEESIPPKERNPHELGTVCKHLISVFRKYFR